MIPNDLVREGLEAALVVAIADPANAPKPLHPFLKFQKMPARAMPAVRKVLDTDDAFRERVASVVDLTMLDRAGGLFLTRPDGWVDELEALASEEARAAADAEEAKAEKSAQKKLKAAETARTKAEDRVRELGAELDRARTSLEQERVARRQAETTAHNVTWDVDNLRKRVRELESEAAAWAENAASPPEAPPAPPAAPAAPPDLSRVVEALHETRRALDSVARAVDEVLTAAPAPDELDGDAADRRVRPPKHARRPSALPGGVHDHSVEAARHLLGLRHVVVVVDGYNVAKRAWPQMSSLLEQRDRLIDRLAGLHASTRAEVWVVFDGTEAAAIAPSKSQPVRVLFTPTGTTADEQILHLVPTVPRERPVVVASSDREVADGARRLGANVISAEQLIASG